MTWINLLLSFFCRFFQARLRQGAMKYLISYNSQSWFFTSKVILYLCSRAGRSELLIFIGVSGDKFLWDLLESKKSFKQVFKVKLTLSEPRLWAADVL